MEEKFTFFWRGPFSQWHKSPFTDAGYNLCFDRKFNCAEQYMMFRKAMLFGDKKTAELIMETTSPKSQKALGRKVTPFDEGKWNEQAQKIVYWGNYLKFKQDPKLTELLFATAGTTLVEASPYDKVWGIGLKEDDHRALSRDTWQGKNWLGECLTAVRDDMLTKKRMDDIFASLGEP